MKLALEDGTPLGGEFVLRAVQRFDLTPVPSTLELVLRIDSSAGDLFRDGTVVLAGTSLDRYRIIKLGKATSEWAQSQFDPATVLEATALLEGVAPLALPQRRAVVLPRASFAQVYRGCGATAPVGADVPAWRFVCLAGQFPTAGIAQLMREEGAVPVWHTDKRLDFVRLQDLFKRDPLDSIEEDPASSVLSGFLEQHEMVRGIATAPDGGVMVGRSDPPREVLLLPGAPARVLDNLARCLVLRRVMSTGFNGSIRAGDRIDVAGQAHVVLTVAHVWDIGAGGTPAEQVSRLWLAQLLR